MKKRQGIIVVIFVFSMVLLGINPAFALWGKKADPDNGAGAKQASEETGKASEPKVVYKFKDADEMTEFEKLYVAKQTVYGRMGVLQAYFAMEQNNLAQIDKQMQDKFGFKMDPTRMYNLNRDTMEITEVGPVPNQQQQPAPKGQE